MARRVGAIWLPIECCAGSMIPCGSDLPFSVEVNSMKRLLTLAVLLLGTSVVGGRMAAAQAQKPPAKAPAPARKPAQEALANWNEIGRKIVAMAEDFPADKYDYKPTPEVRSFSAMVQHVAAVNYFFTNLAAGKEVGKAIDDPAPGTYKTKADVAAFVKKSFADGAAAISAAGEAGMAKEIKHPFCNRLAQLCNIANDVSMHSSEHYGALVVYYRVNNLVPPESRPRK